MAIKDYNKYCIKLYAKLFEKKSSELKHEATSHGNSTLSENKMREIENIAQKYAIRESILAGMKQFSDVPVADIWNAIFQAHIYRKSGISDKSIIDKVVSADQSWKKSSGHAFEEMIKVLANLNLSDTNISVLLQKDLNVLINAGKINNEPRDISWLKEQITRNIFDLYAIIEVDDRKYCFGCIQAKTSIRDRVTRDREPSIHAMQSFFWSSVLVLDGAFLLQPKFRHMVNGGDTEFPENGWHGMYVFSNEPPIDRIYHTDLSLSVFKDHIIKAANDWLKQRQWMSVTWRADE